MEESRAAAAADSVDVPVVVDGDDDWSEKADAEAMEVEQSNSAAADHETLGHEEPSSDLPRGSGFSLKLVLDHILF